MPHRIYVSNNEDVEIVRETLAWSQLKPEEIAEAIHALERMNIHLIRARALLDEAYKWLVSPKFPMNEYGDFLERYRSYKLEESQVEKR